MWLTTGHWPSDKLQEPLHKENTSQQRTDYETYLYYFFAARKLIVHCTYNSIVHNNNDDNNNKIK